MDAHFQYCAEYLRQHDYSRYIACLYLGKISRRVAFAIYAFNIEIENIARQASEPMPGEIRLQWWRDEILQRNASSASPIASALLEVINSHNLPLDIFERLLSARIFDLYNDCMPDRQALEAYLGETRSGLFHLLLLVEGGEITDASYSDACGHSGVFIGTVELLKALPLHINRERAYFPQELSRKPMSKNVSKEEKPMQVDRDWLYDIGKYAFQHHEAAKNAISRLPENYQSPFIGLALAKYELDGILDSGIELNSLAVPLSRLRVNWCLWRAARSIKQ